LLTQTRRAAAITVAAAPFSVLWRDQQVRLEQMNQGPLPVTFPTIYQQQNLY
jgi:hypothetical protein